MVGLGGCSAAPPRAELAAASAGEPVETVVAVVDRGWHTDIALPAAAMTGALARLRDAFPGAQYLIFGFGDKVYYMAREETFLGTLAALFPGAAVVLVTGLRVPPEEAFGADHVVTLGVSCAARGRVAAFIAETLAKPPGGTLARLDGGPYPGSLFYAANQSYDALHDCNRWTVAALRSAGLAVEPDGVFFAGQAMGAARRLAASQKLPATPIDCPR